MRVAIIGAGIFGCTCAIRLSNNNISCELFEEKEDIMLAASRVNQYRLHRGYHYPRSSTTVKQVKNSSYLFNLEYQECIVDTFQNMYGISNKNSLVSSDQYIDFLDRNLLSYKIINDNKSVINENLSLLVEVDESIIDYKSLKDIVYKRLTSNPLVNLKLSTKYEKKMNNEYDYIVNCSYGMCNKIMPKELQKEYKYQLVEKIVVQPPKSLVNKSIVILDGPFMCIDPLPKSNLSILGNVKKAIHNTSYGFEPKNITKHIKPWKNITNLQDSRFIEFINHGKNYISELDQSIFKYSMTGYRVLLPNVESTDERLTTVKKFSKFINIFSGKIDTCCWAANELIKIIK